VPKSFIRLGPVQERTNQKCSHKKYELKYDQDTERSR
jgi:hypothetical protein